LVSFVHERSLLVYLLDGSLLSLVVEGLHLNFQTVLLLAVEVVVSFVCCLVEFLSVCLADSMAGSWRVWLWMPYYNVPVAIDFLS